MYRELDRKLRRYIIKFLIQKIETNLQPETEKSRIH